MSGPAAGPPGGLGAEADADASVVLARLTQVGTRGASLTINALHRTIELICLAGGLTGLVALLLGVWAWHHSLPGAALAVVAGVPTIAVAIYVLVRIRALARAVKQPGRTLAQAQDLVMRAKGSPELHRLARRVASRGTKREAGVGRLRHALRSGRLISAVIGLAGPDPKEHDLLVPFTPARLKTLWLAVTVGLWAWLVCAVIASLAFLSLAIQSL